jgi:hypothetical protein
MLVDAIRTSANESWHFELAAERSPVAELVEAPLRQDKGTTFLVFR